MIQVQERVSWEKRVLARTGGRQKAISTNQGRQTHDGISCIVPGQTRTATGHLGSHLASPRLGFIGHGLAPVDLSVHGKAGLGDRQQVGAHQLGDYSRAAFSR